MRMVFGIFIASLVARALGPERFGAMAFALQVLAFATPFAMLGMDSLLTRWLVHEADQAERIIGQSLLVRLVCGSALLGMGIMAGAWLGWPDELLYSVIALGALVPHGFLTFQRYFVTCQRGGAVFAASALALGLASALRLWLAATAPSVAGFLVLYVLEQAIMGAVLLMLYLRQPEQPLMRPGPLRDTLARAQSSLPLLPTLLAGTIFAVMDFFMLRMWSTPEELGLYGAALRITAALIALQAAMINGLAPMIVRSGKFSTQEASTGMGKVYEAVTLLSVGMIVIVSLFAERIGFWLYGQAYDGVGAIVRIHVWTMLFLGWRRVSANWLIADDALWLTLRRHVPGLICAGLFGPVLIPLYGGTGAAMAMLAGAFMSGFAVDFIGRGTRKHGTAKLRALLFPTLRS